MKDFIGKDISHIPKKELYDLDKEDVEKIIYVAPRTLLVRLRELHAKVNCLVDFVNILGRLDLEDFEVTYNQDVKESMGNPAFFLTEYVLLEINNFYTIIYNENNIDFPEPPEYWQKIENFRNVVPGHADYKKKFKTNEDLLSLYKPLDEIGMDNILKDFNEYFVRCIAILKEQDKKE